MNILLSDTIRSRREQLSVDQKTLSRLSGVSLHALSDLETGKGNPTLSTVSKVLDPLGLELRIGLKSTESGHAQG